MYILNKTIKGVNMKKVITYVISLSLPLCVGVLSALLTMNNMNIYEQINTPPLSPPSILFPIVWTILYILMGISSGIIYTKGISDNENVTSIMPARIELQKQTENALLVYLISLVLNFIWSIVFFNLRKFLFAFVILVALLVTIILTISKYYKINKLASLLQLPYLIWVTFAGYLNIAIYFLN